MTWVHLQDLCCSGEERREEKRASEVGFKASPSFLLRDTVERGPPRVPGADCPPRASQGPLRRRPSSAVHRAVPARRRPLRTNERFPGHRRTWDGERGIRPRRRRLRPRTPLWRPRTAPRLLPAASEATHAGAPTPRRRRSAARRRWAGLSLRLTV